MFEIEKNSKSKKNNEIVKTTIFDNSTKKMLKNSKTIVFFANSAVIVLNSYILIENS